MYNRPYRGYKKNRNRLIRLTLLIFIVFVILLGVLGFLFVQNYLVFTSNGVKVALPFHQSNKNTADSIKEPDLEIVGSTSNKDTNNSQSPNSGNPTNVSETGLRSIAIPVQRLNDITYRNKLIDLYKKGAITSVSVEIKTKAGLLNYDTSIDWAKDLNLSSDASTYFKDGITALKDSGLWVIGQISCFDDNTIAKKAPETAIKTKSGATWLDYSNKRHLNPYNDKTAEYLSGIITECSEMGFSEVVLTDFRFPYKGQLKLISYGDQSLSKNEILTRRLSEFSKAAGSMKVSVFLDEPLAKNGKDVTTGMDISAWYPLAYRIYAPLSNQTAEGENALMLAVSSVTGGDKSKVVPVCTLLDYYKTVTKEASPTSNYFFDLSKNDYSLDKLTY